MGRPTASVRRAGPVARPVVPVARREDPVSRRAGPVVHREVRAFRPAGLAWIRPSRQEGSAS